MPPKFKETTLAELARMAAKSKTFAKKLMEDPQQALRERNLKLPLADLRILAALKAQTDRMVAETKKLRQLMIGAGFVGEGGVAPLGPGVPPPWPWPIEWNDEKGAIGDRIRSLGEKLRIDKIGLPKPVVDPLIVDPVTGVVRDLPPKRKR